MEEYRLIPLEDVYYEDDEIIDIIGILKDLWLNRKTIVSVLGVVFLIGLFIFIASERIYYSETILMPEVSSQQTGLGQLFQQYESILGIAPNMVQEEDITIAMYPYIIESLPFQVELMQQEVYFGDIDQRVTLFEYFSEHHQKSFLNRSGEVLWGYTIGLPFTLWNVIKGFVSHEEDNPLPVDFEELRDFEYPRLIDNRVRQVAATVGDLIAVTRDPQTNFISIGVSLPDARASAEVVNLVRNLLQEYVTDYRTEKAIENMVFLEEMYENSKREFEEIQDSLAAHQDRNIMTTQARARVEEQRLQLEFTKATELFNTLGRRLAEARIKVQEETPVFRVHEPATIPGRPAKPHPVKTFVGSVFIGLFLGILFIYARRGISKFREAFRTKDPKPYLTRI